MSATTDDSPVVLPRPASSPRATSPTLMSSEQPRRGNLSTPFSNFSHLPTIHPGALSAPGSLPEPMQSNGSGSEAHGRNESSAGSCIPSSNFEGSLTPTPLCNGHRSADFTKSYRSVKENASNGRVSTVYVGARDSTQLKEQGSVKRESPPCAPVSRQPWPAVRSRTPDVLKFSAWGTTGEISTYPEAKPGPQEPYNTDSAGTLPVSNPCERVTDSGEPVAPNASGRQTTKSEQGLEDCSHGIVSEGLRTGASGSDCSQSQVLSVPVSPPVQAGHCVPCRSNSASVSISSQPFFPATFRGRDTVPSEPMASGATMTPAPPRGVGCNTPPLGSLSDATAVSAETGIPPNSPLSFLPPYVKQLLIKGRVSSHPCYLSPYHCVLTRHPVHRDITESHLATLVAEIRENGLNESLSIQAPLIAVRYSKPHTFPTRAGGTTRAVVYDRWSDHPLVYAISGGGRAEAIAQLVQASPDQMDVTHQQRALAFYVLNAGENLSAWEIFLLSTAINAADPHSRKPTYFERTDQIAFIYLELSKRQHTDVSCRDVAIEICTNPFLDELRQYLQLDINLVLQLKPLTMDDSRVSPDILKRLTQSRAYFPWLPPNMGILPETIPSHAIEMLDVLTDMASCLNSERMKYISPAAVREREGHRSSRSREADQSRIRTEGFLHAVAEDQLRRLFREIVPYQSASVFDVFQIRELVSVVFGAIQQCSISFRSHATDTGHRQENSSTETYSSRSIGTYWIDRIVHETSPGGSLAGFWNFPAAALVVLFYVYFINKIQAFQKNEIQKRLLENGGTLYRSIAELVLTLRAAKINLMTASVPIQIRVFESASILFRLALFGVVEVQCFPPHPFVIPVACLDVAQRRCEAGVYRKTSTNGSSSVMYEILKFSNFDHVNQFLYSSWLKGIIASRLSPTTDYRGATGPVQSTASRSLSRFQPTPNPLNSIPPSSVSVSSGAAVDATSHKVATPTQDASPGPVQGAPRRRPWYEARRMAVAATTNRIRQEVEAAFAAGNFGSSASHGVASNRICVKRLSRRSVPGGSTSETAADHVEVDVLDPSVLPMAQTAKLEFQSLVQGVITMLIERHRCLVDPNGSGRANLTDTGSHDSVSLESSGPTPDHSRNIADAAHTATQHSSVQVLSVPANMVVLAAIKVALTFISPHFDRLAPHLVHWITVRCRLILWIWRSCQAEVVKRAEDRWNDLWTKQRPQGPPPPPLEVRFTSMERTDGQHVALTSAKLAEVVLTVLPRVLESMTAFYEERDDWSDSTVTREFFANWLRAAGDNDVVAHVNRLLTQPLRHTDLTTGSLLTTHGAHGGGNSKRLTPDLNASSNRLRAMEKGGSLGSTGSTTVHQSSSNGNGTFTIARGYAPHLDEISGPVGVGTPTGVATTASPSGAGTATLAHGQPYVSSAQEGYGGSVPPTHFSLASRFGSHGGSSYGSTPYLLHPGQSSSTGIDGERVSGRRTRRGNTHLAGVRGSHGPGSGTDNEDLAEWLENLPYTERLRLQDQDVPIWELPHMIALSPSDLLRWKLPRDPMTSPLTTGNNSARVSQDRWPNWDINRYSEARKRNFYKELKKEKGCHCSLRRDFALSDLDWKVIVGVLKLLRSRGIDTLVSRRCGKVFFLDTLLSNMADATKRALYSNGTPSSLHLPRRLQNRKSREKENDDDGKQTRASGVDRVAGQRTTPSSVNQGGSINVSGTSDGTSQQNQQLPQEHISSVVTEGTGAGPDANVSSTQGHLNVQTPNGNLEFNTEHRTHDHNVSGTLPEQPFSPGYQPRSRATLTHPSRNMDNQLNREEHPERNNTLQVACGSHQKSTSSNPQLRISNDNSANSGDAEQLSYEITSAQEELMDRILDVDIIRFFLEYNSSCPASWSSDNEESDTESTLPGIKNADTFNGRGGTERSDSDTGPPYGRLRSPPPSDQPPKDDVSYYPSNRHSTGLQTGVCSSGESRKRYSTDVEHQELPKSFEKKICVTATDEDLSSCEPTCHAPSVNDPGCASEKNAFARRSPWGTVEESTCEHAAMLTKEEMKTHTPPTFCGFSSTNQFSSLPSSSEDSHPDDQSQHPGSWQNHQQPSLEQGESIEEDESCCIMGEPVLTLDEPMEIMEVSNIPLPED